MRVKFDNPAAMAPFYNDAISVEGARSGGRIVKGSFRACVFPNGFADPVSDADADADVQTFTILIPAGEWLDHTHPQVGDLVTLDSGEKLAVSRIDSLTGDTWSLTAKEVD